MNKPAADLVPYMKCPRCGVDAIPADEWSRRWRKWLWMADGVLHKCPGCPALLRVAVTDDYEDDAVATVEEVTP